MRREARQFAYHQWSVQDLEKFFETDRTSGLTPVKAAYRLEKNGPNLLSLNKRNTALVILVRQFANFFILLLIGAAVIAYFVDGLAQAMILGAVVLLNVILGFFQENKAEKSVQELKAAFVAKTRVIRAGAARNVESGDIVLGDLVLLEAGDRVPADLRIIEEESLRIDESALTGESLPIGQTCLIFPPETALADRRNLAYASSLVVAGHGKGIVVATGRETEFGKIALLLADDKDTTPLEKQVFYLGKILSLFAIAIAATIFFVGFLNRENLWELLSFTLALMIAVVPESLPTAITLVLSIGAGRMAKKKAIVKRMSVIEALGTTNVIATDKTGTLTENKLAISEIALYRDKIFEDFELDSVIAGGRSIQKIIFHGLACSNIILTGSESGLLGDPLEVAIARAVLKLGASDAYEAKGYRRLMEIPFDSDRKFMAVSVQTKEGKSLIAKGAAETIVEFCRLSDTEKEKILAKAKDMSSYGLKVIALAEKTLGNVNDSTPKNMAFMGLFGFIDQPAADVKAAIRATLAAGIRPIIITGDHPETAVFVANKVGLPIGKGDVVSGIEFDKMTDGEKLQVVKRIKIFARVSPQNKIEIVSLLQKQGHSVAMTGDGINDAPALKMAQVGISMGIRGTDVAKDSADIVLANDRYSSIVAAIEYGRSIYDNIRNTIVFLISGNLLEMTLVAVAFFFGLPLPFTALQLIWINLITDSLLALPLCFEKPSSNVMREMPRPRGENSLKKALTYALILGLTALFLALALYLWGLNYSPAKARTLVFCFVIGLQIALVFSLRSKKRIWQSLKSFAENRYLLIAVMLVLLLQLLLFLEPLAALFKLKPLFFGEIFVVFVFSLIMFLVAELIRHFYDRITIDKSK